ncbi:MAG: hypothetical protein ABF301_00855 [Sulfurovum sp.]
MVKRKKVEIIIESVYLNRLVDFFNKNDVIGYTVIKNIQGAGGHGLKLNDDITDVFTNNYVFVVFEEEKLTEINESLIAFLKRYGAKCILTDIMWLSY